MLMGFFEIKGMLKRSLWVCIYAGIITKRTVIGGFHVFIAKLKQRTNSKTLTIATLTLINACMTLRRSDMPRLDCNSSSYFLSQHKYYYLLAFKENLLTQHATRLLPLSAKLKSEKVALAPQTCPFPRTGFIYSFY